MFLNRIPPTILLAVTCTASLSLAESAELALITRSGDRFRGAWLDSESSAIAWSVPDFHGKFRFPIEAAAAIYSVDDEVGDDEAAAERPHWKCQLRTGDVFVGSLVELDQASLRLMLEPATNEPAEPLTIPTHLINRLTPVTRETQALVMLPDAKQGLTERKPNDWELIGGELVAKSPDKQHDIALPDLPPRCLIEIEVSWDSNSDFSIAVTPEESDIDQGIRPNRFVVVNGNVRLEEKKKDYSGLRIESLGTQVALLAQSSTAADILLLADKHGTDGSGEMRLSICVDAEKQEATAYLHGARIGKLKLPVELKTEWTQRSKFLRLNNYEGVTTVHRFAVSSWDGLSPKPITFDSPVLMTTTDGSEIAGRLKGWDGKSLQFTVELPRESDPETSESAGDLGGEENSHSDTKTPGEDELTPDELTAPGKDERPGLETDPENDIEAKVEDAAEENDAELAKANDTFERQVNAAEVAEIQFAFEPGSTTNALSNAGSTDDAELPKQCTVQTNGGSVIKGNFAGIVGSRLRLQSTGLDQIVNLRLDSIHSVTFALAAWKKTARSLTSDRTTDEKHVIGTFRTKSIHSKGWLADAEASADSSCLAWHPSEATNACRLLADATGRIVYHVPKANVAKPKSPARRKRNGIVAGLADFLGRASASVANEESKKKNPKVTKTMTLDLRSGDSIPCHPKLIDEQGVTFDSTLSDVTFVPHELVRAISLRSEFDRRN